MINGLLKGSQENSNSLKFYGLDFEHNFKKEQDLVYVTNVVILVNYIE
jgi:hypothetical protein